MRFFLLLVLSATGIATAAQPTRRPSDLERGETLYRRHCETCHGATARGDGPSTDALVADVPNLRGRVNPDDATVRLVLRGQGSMPGYMATMDKYDARRVLRFIKHLSQPRAELVPEPVEPEEEGEEDPAEDDAPVQ